MARADACHISIMLAKALQALHAEGVVYAQLCPTNIIMNGDGDIALEPLILNDSRRPALQEKLSAYV